MTMCSPRHERWFPGSPGFRLVKREARGQRGLDCWLALPDRPRHDVRPMVAIHGICRGAEQQAAAFAERASAQGRVVIAPLFENAQWPGYQLLVHRGRADLALLALMEELRTEHVWNTRRFDLSGYSGGAQFAHRFAMLYPQLIARLSVCSAGWWTFPDQAPFPYGLGAEDGCRPAWGPRLAAILPRFLRLPITVAVGADDNVPDANTRSGSAIDRQQGLDRRTRAERWVEALTTAASAHGIAANVTLSILPDCGHDFAACVRRGGLVDHVLPDPSPTVTPLDAAASHPDHHTDAGRQAATGRSNLNHPVMGVGR
jgi:pimeloyl-ACP methyl ester carboxylesterase